MIFEQFERRAHEMFDSIPEEFREGVDGLVVERGVQPHPSLPDIYTLGECRSEFYPSEFGGPGEVRSFVVLFHGSFQRLSELDEEWDWEGELWETITHEVQHHLESLASEDALEVEDFVVDQNFARRQGEPFDPFFYRDGVPADDGIFEVDGDVFVEREIDPSSAVPQFLDFMLGGRDLLVAVPETLGDVHYITLRDVAPEQFDVVLVLVRRKGVWESLRSALSGKPLELLQSESRSLG